MNESTRLKQRELEQLTARLFALFPDADGVDHDVRIRGKSGILRQVDVLVRKKIGPVEATIIIDTKFKGKKVRRTDVMNVHDIKEDVGAALAVLVAPRGFDRGTRKFAETHDIQLLKSINTADADWAGRLALPAFFEVRILHYWTDTPLPTAADEAVHRKLTEWRDQRRLPPDIDKHSYSFTVTCVKSGETVAKVIVSFQEERSLRRGRLPLAFFGLFNEGNKEFATERMSTNDFLLSEVMSEWTEVSARSPSEIPLYASLVTRGELEGGTVDVPVPDFSFRMELLPKDALIDLKPQTTSVPFRFSFRPA